MDWFRDEAIPMNWILFISYGSLNVARLHHKSFLHFVSHCERKTTKARSCFWFVCDLFEWPLICQLVSVAIFIESHLRSNKSEAQTFNHQIGGNWQRQFEFVQIMAYLSSGKNNHQQWERASKLHLPLACTGITQPIYHRTESSMRCDESRSLVIEAC